MMRFFTPSNSAAHVAGAEYERYWKEHGHIFPYNLLRLNGGMLSERNFANRADAIFLHDARIQAAIADAANITLLMHGDHLGGLREITLRYIGVTQHTPITDDLLANNGGCDLLAHETTVVGEGRFNHKMLFANTVIVSIDFADIDIDIVDHPPQCVPNLDSQNEDERRWGIIEASKSADRSSIPKLLVLLRQDTDANQRHIVRALGNIGGQDAQDMLLAPF